MFRRSRQASQSRAGARLDRRTRQVSALALWIVAVAITAAGAFADDWPTYRHDMARSGISTDGVLPPLTLSWVYQARHAPEPAWGDPKPVPVEDILELRRVHFDDVFQPVVAGGAVYFGSSADNKVYCLDAATGRGRWAKITGGPIRLAPTVDGERVLVGSDDGVAYCLRADDGSVIWQFRAAPEDKRALGHGKMISLWPLRSGILVDDGVAYLSAGIFPAEGVFLYAVDAATGREIWRNDSCGEAPQSRISPQGYLLASKANLYVPMGRVSPAAFDRSDGRLKYETFFGKTIGGTYALLAGEHIYTGTEEMIAYKQESRDRFATFAGRKMVVTADTAYLASNTELTAMDRAKDPGKAVRWKTPCDCPDSLILAGNVLYAGGDGRVAAFDAGTGQRLWQAEVDGKAKGLAAADGRLLVSTHSGKIYCFGPQGSAEHGVITEPVVEDPYADSPLGKMFAQAAETILQRTGVDRGYCLVLGCETGQLALELAKRSQLQIYAVSPDPKKVAAARRALDAAGVYGVRICVEQWPLDKVPYSDYFANLIVSETAMTTGQPPGNVCEVFRMLKPLGGKACIGQPARRAEAAKPLANDALRRLALDLERWPDRSELTDAHVSVYADGPWLEMTRGALPGAGSWTHQYAEAGNTACGDDLRVDPPLGVLWFGRPGPRDMVNRHARAAGPLSIDGRLFIQGENTVMAYDAYNGVKLWQREIPGAVRTQASHDSGNLALSRDGLFVAVGDKCLRLDPATGQTQANYTLPPAADGGRRRWGYIARAGKLLFGSRAAAARQSDCLFAVDVETAKPRWVHDARQIPHNAIAIGDGTVFLVSNDVTQQQRDELMQQRQASIEELPKTQQASAKAALKRFDARMLTALEAETGRVRWQKPVDLTDCGGFHAATPDHPAILASMYNQGVLVLFGVYLDGHHWEQFFAGQFDSRRVMAVSGESGDVLWSRQVGFRVRPVIVRNTLHAEPWAFDLHTGEPRTRVHPVTGQTDLWQFARPGHHCGCPCASPNCLFFRSYNLGYYDLPGDYGTMHFGAQRPGCWINFIPAGGLLLMPEASAGCMCPFPNMCSIALKPVKQNKAWAMYSARGPMTPVKRLAINFGAAGDRKDALGKLWLSYPRPFTGRLVLPMAVDASFYSGGGFVRGNSAYTPFRGTDDPWLFASSARGLRKCAVPLLGEADGSALYRVICAFADPENDQPGRRVFDIKLQGKTVEEDFDAVRAAGGRNRVVLRQFEGIEVHGKLEIELVAKGNPQQPEQLPILQGIEIVRQRVLTLCCSVPGFLLSSLEPEQSGDVVLTNLHEDPVQGTLIVEAPKGFEITPGKAQVTLAAGERETIPVKARATGGVPAGHYAVAVRLLRGDGTPELERKAQIEYLGRRGRVVLQAIEDAHVTKRYPDRNQGSAKVVLVDGGDKAMGDNDHSLAYLKFRLDVPGKPLTATLRITNAGNPTGDSGRVCLVTEPWTERQLTYRNRPKPAGELGRLGRVVERQVVECPLAVQLSASQQLSLVIDPTGCDGIDYVSREGDSPPELVVEYEPQ